MFEEARTLRGMIDMCSLTQTEIAKRMGVSQSYIANKLRLLNFSDRMQRLIKKSALTERHARALLKLKDEEKIEAAIEKIKAMRLNVAASEVLIDRMSADGLVRDMRSCESDGIQRFEEIVALSVKNLMTQGFRVRQKTDDYENMRYITICIEK
jgi:ParB family chromosome partitioning protein